MARAGTPAKRATASRMPVQPPPQELVPEADRLGEFPHPRHTRDLLGHHAAETELKRAFDGGRSHHGWMLTGRAGIGKATLAYAAARYILAEPVDRGGDGLSLDPDFSPSALSVAADSVAFRQVAALSHPGLLLLRRPWDTKTKRHMSAIPVDEVRKLRSFLALSAGGGERRVVIADSLDEMNTNAANALLKGLEEPPPGLIFLLVCSEPGRVLPTIRSRCRTLDLRPLSDADVITAAKAAAANATTPVDLPSGMAEADLATLAEGSVRRYLALAATDGVKLNARVTALFDRLPRIDWPEVMSFADDIQGADKAERFDQTYDLILDVLARLIRAKLGSPRRDSDVALATRVITDARLSAAADLWTEAVREKAELDALNLDRRSLFLSLVQRLARLGA